MKKKKFSENRPAAIAILVLVALLAIPLLGGLRLSLDYNSAAKKFEKAVKTDRHGNDLFSDTDIYIRDASDLLDEGTRIAGENGIDISQRGSALRSAIDKTKNAKSAAERYLAYYTLRNEAKLFYAQFIDNKTDVLYNKMFDANSTEDKIERTYRPAYTEFISSRRNMISGFPAAQLAELYHIGG